MPDREKVIKGWETVLSRDPLDAPWDLIDETLTLLKEQEAIEPIPYHRSDGTIFKYECRQCGTKIFKMDLFCRHCGRSVKWK